MVGHGCSRITGKTDWFNFRRCAVEDRVNWRLARCFWKGKAQALTITIGCCDDRRCQHQIQLFSLWIACTWSASNMIMTKITDACALFIPMHNKGTRNWRSGLACSSPLCSPTTLLSVSGGQLSWDRNYQGSIKGQLHVQMCSHLGVYQRWQLPSFIHFYVLQAPGRRLLVATTAAEEGLDVPSCELVRF